MSTGPLEHDKDENPLKSDVVAHCAITNKPLKTLHCEFFEGRQDLPHETSPADWNIIMTYDEVNAAIRALACKLNEWYRHKTSATSVTVKILAVLKGVFPTVAALSHWLTFPCEFYFVHGASYSGTIQGDLVIKGMPDVAALAGSSVIIVDELWETGNTMIKMREALEDLLRTAGSVVDVKTCVLIAKPIRADAPPERRPDFVCISDFPSVWLVGFGLDWDQLCRGWRNMMGRCSLAEALKAREQLAPQLEMLRFE